MKEAIYEIIAKVIAAQSVGARGLKKSKYIMS